MEKNQILITTTLAVVFLGLVFSIIALNTQSPVDSSIKGNFDSAVSENSGMSASQQQEYENFSCEKITGYFSQPGEDNNRCQGNYVIDYWKRSVGGKSCYERVEVCEEGCARAALQKERTLALTNPNTPYPYVTWTGELLSDAFVVCYRPSLSDFEVYSFDSNTCVYTYESTGICPSSSCMPSRKQVRGRDVPNSPCWNNVTNESETPKFWDPEEKRYN